MDRRKIWVWRNRLLLVLAWALFSCLLYYGAPFQDIKMAMIESFLFIAIIVFSYKPWKKLFW